MSRLATAFAVLGIVSAVAGGAVLLHSPAPAATETPPLEDSTGYTDLHELGVTGENVTVGVADPSGFDLGDPVYADQTAAAQAFGDGKTLANGGNNDHGTAVAETVATVAPDSEVYLASFAEESDYRDALEWFADREVDVVVLPTSVFGKPGDGSAASTRATARLARDAVVVTASGNLGEGHWTGTYEPDAGATMPARGPDGDRLELEVTDGRTQLWLSWTPPTERYRLRLTRNGSTVATSEPYPGDDVPNEHIDEAVPAGTYELVVDGPANATGTRLRLETPSDRLRNGQRAGSIVAPATARGVVAVGGYNDTAGRVPRYSSSGPTADGRNGVDLVAPVETAPERAPGPGGTSYAAGYAGGVAALVLSAAEGLSPETVEAVLERSAVDLGPPGWDATSGHGLVDPPRAVAVTRRQLEAKRALEPTS